MTDVTEWDQPALFQNDNGRAYQIEIICRNDNKAITVKFKKMSLPGWVQCYDRVDWKHPSKHGIYAILSEIWDLIESDTEIVPHLEGNLQMHQDVEGF